MEIVVTSHLLRDDPRISLKNSMKVGIVSGIHAMGESDAAFRYRNSEVSEFFLIYPTNLAPICGGGDIQKLQANLTNFPTNR